MGLVERGSGYFEKNIICYSGGRVLCGGNFIGIIFLVCLCIYIYFDWGSGGVFFIW